jgi:hypothetical protein
MSDIPRYTIDLATGNVIREDGLVILPDDRLTEYREYVAWLAQENTPGQIYSAPPTSRLISRLEFLDRFTLEELAAILTARKSSALLDAWITKLEMATEIDLDSPRLTAGLDALVAAQLISASRAAQILGIA